MKTTPDHPDFTALALGEHIHGSPAQAVLDALRHSAAVRGEADAICAAGARLARGLKSGPALGLDDARREAIFTADPAAIRARFAAGEHAPPAAPPAAPPPSGRPARPWIYPTAAAAAVALAAIVVLRLLPGYSAPGRLRTVPGATAGAAEEEDAAPTGHILVTPVDPRPREAIPAPRSRRPETPDVVNTPAPPIPPPGKGRELSRPATPPALARDIPPARPVLPAPPPAPPAAGPPRDFASPPLLKRPN